MRTKLIAALLAGGCLIGYQAAAVAQEGAPARPTVSTPTQAQQNPTAASQDRDRQAAPSGSNMTGQPAASPQQTGH
jgi:hypothetical protein